MTITAEAFNRIGLMRLPREDQLHGTVVSPTPTQHGTQILGGATEHSEQTSWRSQDAVLLGGRLPTFRVNCRLRIKDALSEDGSSKFLRNAGTQNYAVLVQSVDEPTDWTRITTLTKKKKTKKKQTTALLWPSSLCFWRLVQLQVIRTYTYESLTLAMLRFTEKKRRRSWAPANFVAPTEPITTGPNVCTTMFSSV